MSLATSRGVNGRTAGLNRTQLTAQQRAAEQLRALAKPYRFRVESDVEGFPIANRKLTQTSPRSLGNLRSRGTSQCQEWLLSDGTGNRSGPRRRPRRWAS